MFGNKITKRSRIGRTRSTSSMLTHSSPFFHLAISIPFESNHGNGLGLLGWLLLMVASKPVITKGQSKDENENGNAQTKSQSKPQTKPNS